MALDFATLCKNNGITADVVTVKLVVGTEDSITFDKATNTLTLPSDFSATTVDLTTVASALGAVPVILDAGTTGAIGYTNAGKLAALCGTGTIDKLEGGKVYSGFTMTASNLDATATTTKPAIIDCSSAVAVNLTAAVVDADSAKKVLLAFDKDLSDITFDAEGTIEKIGGVTTKDLSTFVVTFKILANDGQKTVWIDKLAGSTGEDGKLKLSSADLFVGVENKTALTFTDTKGIKIDLNDTTKFKKINNVTGTNYADEITALAGGSTLAGGNGNDTLIGGAGNDSLIGNAGKDVFVISDNGGADAISGYDFKDDKIKFTDSLFTDLTISTLNGTDIQVTVNGSANTVKLENLSTGLDTKEGKVKIEDMVGNTTNVVLGQSMDYVISTDKYVYDGLSGGTLNITKSGAVDIWLDTEKNNNTIKNVKKINASKANGQHILHGDSLANELIGGTGVDKLWGGAKGTNTVLGSANTLTGNGGADMFFIGADEGFVKITDYSAKDGDVIKFYKDAFTAVTVNGVGNNAELAFSDEDKVIVDNAVKNKTVLTVEDSAGNKGKLLVGNTALDYAAGINKYVGNGAAVLKLADGQSANLWLGNDDGRSGADFKGVSKIDASATKAANELHGDSKENELTGGSGNDALWGGTGADNAGVAGQNVLTGGKGADKFFIGSGEGNTLIKDYSTADSDAVVFYKNSFTDVSVSALANDAVIAFDDDNKITLKNATNTAVTVTDKDGNKGKMLVAGATATSIAYDKDINAYHGNSTAKLVVGAAAGAVNIWLDSTYEGKAGADYNKITEINASASSAANQLHGNDENNYIVGGSGNDAIWAGKGGNNTVVGGGGADTFFITADGENTTIKDGTALDTVLLYNCGITDIANVYATLGNDNKLTINVGNSSVTIENWSEKGLDTFKVSENAGVAYKFDKETSKLVAKA